MPWVIDTPREMKGQLLGDRVIRDFGALTLGFVFWLLIRSELRSREIIFRATRLMLRTFWIVLPFCMVQIMALLLNNDAMRAIDSAVSFFRSPHAPGYGKIFGLAPEASMLADQIITMYIPFALASIVANVSLSSHFQRGARKERVIFALAIVVLVFTLSRIGFVALIATLCCTYALAPKVKNSNSKPIPLTGIVVVIVVFGIVLIAAGGRLSGFLGSFAGVDASIDGGIWSNVTRAGCMATGLLMFLHHPLGVGTGVFPFLFERYAPDWALLSPEVQALIGNNYDALTATGAAGGDIASRLPDAKAIPIRVLAEMGIPGILLFGAGWVYQVRSCWQVAKASEVPAEQAIAFGCVLSFLAMLPLAFNINSYIWVHWLFISAIGTSLVNRQRRHDAPATHSSPLLQ